MKLCYEFIGRRIKEIRLKKGFTQDNLSELTDLSIQHISNIERAHSKMSIETLVKIANVLEVTPDILMCDCIHKSKAVFTDELADLVEQADDREIKVIVQMFKSLIPMLRENYNQEE